MAIDRGANLAAPETKACTAALTVPYKILTASPEQRYNKWMAKRTQPHAKVEESNGNHNARRDGPSPKSATSEPWVDPRIWNFPKNPLEDAIKVPQVIEETRPAGSSSIRALFSCRSGDGTTVTSA